MLMVTCHQLIWWSHVEAIFRCTADLWAVQHKRQAQLLANLYAVVTSVWVVICIILMSRKAAKAACVC